MVSDGGTDTEPELILEKRPLSAAELRLSFMGGDLNALAEAVIALSEKKSGQAEAAVALAGEKNGQAGEVTALSEEKTGQTEAAQYCTGLPLEFSAYGKGALQELYFAGEGFCGDSGPSVLLYNPWKLEDCLELSGADEEKTEISENYNRIAGILKYAAALFQNQMLHEINGMMKAYYAGELSRADIGNRFREFCREQLNREWEECAEEEGHLLFLYECFSRANVRAAVGKNNREGKGVVEESGLFWAGTTYYNAAYYYAWADIQKLFRNICTELSEEYGFPRPAYRRVEENTRFAPEGGLSYQEVFEWVQMQNNYPCDKYGFRRRGMKPPRHFIYLYRNGYCSSEEGGVRLLGECLGRLTAEEKEGSLYWRWSAKEGGTAYCNGRSSLLVMDEEGVADRRSYRYAMEFLENFKLYRISGAAEFLYAPGPCAGITGPYDAMNF